jgi:hypothetical protein
VTEDPDERAEETLPPPAGEGAPLAEEAAAQPTVPDQRVPPREDEVQSGDPEAEQEVGGG